MTIYIHDKGRRIYDGGNIARRKPLAGGYGG